MKILLLHNPIDSNNYKNYQYNPSLIYLPSATLKMPYQIAKHLSKGKNPDVLIRSLIPDDSFLIFPKGDTVYDYENPNVDEFKEYLRELLTDGVAKPYQFVLEHFEFILSLVTRKGPDINVPRDQPYCTSDCLPFTRRNCCSYDPDYDNQFGMLVKNALILCFELYENGIDPETWYTSVPADLQRLPAELCYRLN